MKNFILQNLNNFAELTSEEIMNLNNDTQHNSPFKLNLLKDKEKGAKVSDSKFYLANGNNVIKFQYDEECKRLAVFANCDLLNLSNFVAKLKSLDVTKIEFYCVDCFTNLKNSLLSNGYVLELTRVDRFLNNNTYENEVVISYLKEDM